MPPTDPPQHTTPSETAASPGDWAEVSELVASIYQIVDRLEALFPGRKFTPDGHLVGSIGEVIAARMFDLDLLPASTAHHDAIARDGRKVQIKFTQGIRRVALRAEPEHLLVLRLAPDRSVELVYNGKGRSPWVNAGTMQKNGQREISLSHLRSLDASASDHDRLSHGKAINLGIHLLLSG